MPIWDKISDWWWKDHSSTHHNREEVDIEAMKRNARKLTGKMKQDALERIAQYEQEARDGERLLDKMQEQWKQERSQQ